MFDELRGRDKNYYRYKNIIDIELITIDSSTFIIKNRAFINYKLDNYNNM